MLAQMFSTISLPPNKPNHLTDPPSAFCELKHAIHCLQSNKSGDDIGVVAEMLRYLPDDFLGTLLTLHNDVLREGCVPHTWHTIWFLPLAKSQRAKLRTDFGPTASIRLLYNIFVYMILSRIDNVLDTTAKVTYKLEEHLLTANIVIDRFLAVGLPVWVVSLGLTM